MCSDVLFCPNSKDNLFIIMYYKEKHEIITSENLESRNIWHFLPEKNDKNDDLNTRIVADYFKSTD